MTNESLHDFIHMLANDVAKLRVAAQQGDAALIKALNAFALAFSQQIVI